MPPILGLTLPSISTALSYQDDIGQKSFVVQLFVEEEIWIQYRQAERPDVLIKYIDKKLQIQVVAVDRDCETVTQGFTLYRAVALRPSVVDPHGFKGNLKMEVYLIPADSQDS
ncbi:hypothetical protein Tco_1019540 [Tanacetum coccineum]|uniref:Uncharacterized protein n=1 Tax=Tanacetum coccineum TaxID=301880 RepID=A0ABQ5FXI1_9ASTR